MNLQSFATAELAAQALAEQIIPALRGGIAQRGAASLVVPGGRTPLPLFHALRDASLDWSRVGVTLTDERWVNEEHAASNAGLVRRELLAPDVAAGAAHFYPLYADSGGVSAAATAGWQSLATMSRPFDAVVLGMGDDGHFASLFAQSPGLSAALDPAAPAACVAMLAPAQPVSRISLNLAALLQTRRLFLFLAGVCKRDLLLAAARTATPEPLPVATLLSQQMVVPEVYWAP